MPKGIPKEEQFSKKGTNLNLSKIQKMNEYFDSGTPLVMCGTECLLDINPKSVFLGQPQKFLAYNPDKKPDSIGHIATSNQSDIHKGTNKIAQAFDKIDFIPAEIIGRKKVPHDQCMSFMDRMGMFVATMTDFNSGIGYTTLEAASRSCLVMSKTPIQSRKIKSKVLHVRNPDILISMTRHFVNNPDIYEKTRREQYDWFVNNFSYNAIANRFRKLVTDAIDEGWSV